MPSTDLPDRPRTPASHHKPPGKSQARGRAIAQAIDRSALRRAYEDGASTVDLAFAYAVSRSTIRVLLKRAGCTIRTLRQASQVRERSSYLRRAPPEPVDGFETVTDVFGVVWRVIRVSPTPHGFSVEHGRRLSDHRGRATVILTQALAAHLERHRLAPRNLALPLGQCLINRLRRRLALDFARENAAWWQARREDLDRLSTAAFAARHGVREGTVMVVRRRLCGLRPSRRAWLDDAARALILSDRPCAEIAAALGKKTGSIYELRCKLRRQEAPERSEASPRTRNQRRTGPVETVTALAP